MLEHDGALIRNWNETISPDDEVWHLGDVMSPMAGSCDELLAELNGRKHLIVGNNDPETTTGASGWESEQHCVELRLDGHHLIMCHYAFRTWNQMGKKSINLHGHSHGRLKPLPRQFDVGVDAQGLRPVTLDYIIRRKPVSPVVRKSLKTRGGVLTTPDGRYIVVRGRLWRKANPHISEAERKRLVAALMSARRAVEDAARHEEKTRAARKAVAGAKKALGERGSVWWTDAAPNLNRHMAHTTEYAEWYSSLPKSLV